MQRTAVLPVPGVLAPMFSPGSVVLPHPEPIYLPQLISRLLHCLAMRHTTPDGHCLGRLSLPYCLVALRRPHRVPGCAHTNDSSRTTFSSSTGNPSLAIPWPPYAVGADLPRCVSFPWSEYIGHAIAYRERPCARTSASFFPGRLRVGRRGPAHRLARSAPPKARTVIPRPAPPRLGSPRLGSLTSAPPPPGPGRPRR